MKTILAPIDFSDATGPVLEVASSLAHAFKAKIVLLNVLPPATIMNDRSLHGQRLSVITGLKMLEKLLEWQIELQNDGATVEIKQYYGQPAACIREEAELLEADTIVIGSHGEGAHHSAGMGTTASDLLKTAPCPVLLVPVTGFQPALTDHRDGTQNLLPEIMAQRSDSVASHRYWAG